QGHSGGGLLDKNFDIVGMLKSDIPPYGEAISIAAIRETLRQWHLPVDLGGQSVPNTFSLVSPGRVHACGLTTTGAVYCWGNLGTGGFGGGGFSRFTATPTRIIGGLTFRSISSGAYYTCGVSDTGTAYCWGNNHYGQLGSDSKDNRFPVPASGGLTFRV